MDELTLTKTHRIIIGCIAVIIIAPFIWHNYQQYREQEEAKAQYLRVCGMLKGTIMVPEDCTKPLD
ncbi:hypothetical protein [Nostoc sp.]|uniref:hypothetical protein n=1 Tax=Nostoc sp. TaxID=1180 RepID=UPI002FF9C6A0